MFSRWGWPDGPGAGEVVGEMDPQAYYLGQAEIWVLAAEVDREGLQAREELFEQTGVPEVAFLNVATLMGDQKFANELAARIDARPAEPIWLAHNGIVTCHCGNGFDLDATPRFKNRLEQAGAPLDLPSLMGWPLQKN